MNAFWKDPSRRELFVAAAAGACWAMLGLALAARGEESWPISSGSLPFEGRVGEGGGANTSAASCRIHNYLGNGTANVGSGTLVDVTANRRGGLVLSCAHLFTEGVGRVIVEFADGRTHGARVRAVDRDADLSALEIASPAAEPAPVSLELDGAGPLTACGFGPAGQYRCISGEVVGASQDAGRVNLKMAGAVRSGDSGGGVFDSQGRLVAVVWGESGGVTYASCGAPLRNFLDRVRGRAASSGQMAGVGSPLSLAATSACPNGICPLTAPRATTPACPNGICPLQRPGALGSAPIATAPPAGGACTCGCGAQITAIGARIAALESGKQDRGEYVAPSDLAPYARADQLALVDQQNVERHQSLVDRLERLAPLVGAVGRAAAPLATTALGVSGPLGWGILAAASVGAWFVGRRMKQKARGASQRAPSLEATAAAVGAFHTGAVQLDTQQPIERDDREARELLRLSQLEGRDPLQDALAGRLALDRLDAVADGDADSQRARWADELRRELRDRFNEIAPTKFQVKA